MNKNRFLAVGAGIVLVIMLLMFSMTYSVKFHEVAVKSRFGATHGDPVTSPGLHFKLPIFADRVTTFDTRNQLLLSPTEEIATADGQSVVVQAFLLWKVDPDSAGQFARSYGSLDAAERQIQDRFRQAMSAVSQFRFDELIGSEHRLVAAENAVLADLEELQTRGIIPVKVGLSQLLLPPKATGSVLSRMRATRERLAEIQRMRGSSEAERIIAEANAKAGKIRAFAEQRAQEIRNLGTNQAAQYLAQMSQDEELAIFLVWLDAYESALSDNLTAILPTTSAPFHLADLETVVSASGIPQPKDGVMMASPSRPAPEADIAQTSSSAGSDASTSPARSEHRENDHPKNDPGASDDDDVQPAPVAKADDSPTTTASSDDSSEKKD